jgi:hypothetical protein
MLPVPCSSRTTRRVPRRSSRIQIALVLALLGFVVGAGWAPLAAAHGRSVSYSNWEIDPQGASVSVRIKLLELSRLGPDALPPGSVPRRDEPGEPDFLARLLPDKLVLIAGGLLCSPNSIAERRPDEPGWVRYQWRVECPPNALSLAIRSQILLDVAPSHMHFARVHFSEEQNRVREQVLTEASPEFQLRHPGRANSDSTSDDEIGSSFVDYLELGVDHILTGWDHLAFVFGLLLLASRFGEVARLITGFTLAHSLTLALAVQGFVHPRAAAVEATIAFSVALVAIEKSWLASDRNRVVPIAVLASLAVLGLASVIGWASLPVLTISGLMIFTGCYFALASLSTSEWIRVCLTFAFGLVHGFGFAGVLVEMMLPTDRLVPALIGFNLGVEIGQIGVVLLLWPILRLAAHFSSNAATRFGSELAAAALCGLGVYWLIERAFPF